MAEALDYSLYLVTGRELLPPGKHYLQSLEESLQGGVTVVQVREKQTDTGEFIQIAQQSQALCRRYNVPLIINDRIDIALAVGAQGVHLGQTDAPIALARRLLPPGSIIGISCNTKEHVRAAREDGADYVGIGAVWGTQTKKLTSEVIGVRGVGEMLSELDGSSVKAVGIGGIKSTNAMRTLHGAVSISGHALDGLAVVSDIVASVEPRVAAQKLFSIVREFKSRIPKSLGLSFHDQYTLDSIKAGVASLLKNVRESKPLIHQITNNVVTNQSANATLALGASPIMATAPQEMDDLSKAIGALLINFGTITDRDGMLLAGHYANLQRKPVVFDPVGVGATGYRRKTAKELMNTWQASVIKGNAGELAALANSTEVLAKGVDSAAGSFADPASFVRKLALRERCPVVLTGATDWASDGRTVVRMDNGHPMLGDITGSGCLVGTCVATFCAAANTIGTRDQVDEDSKGSVLTKGDMFLAAIGGVTALTVASEIAVETGRVYGTGTFLPALIDALYTLTPEVLTVASSQHSGTFTLAF